jgi:hypothetical protein
MSSGPSDAPGEQERQIASQDAYEQEVVESDWFETQSGWFQVQTIRPLKLLRDARKYGVLDLLGGDADDDAIREAMVSGGFDLFMGETIVPSIIQPTAYWDEDDLGDDVEADDAFDVAALDPEDLFGMIETMTGASQEELSDKADQLRGNQ